MKNFRKHIDDFFREKLGKYIETPPPEAWDELSVKLDTLKPYLPGSTTRWFWHAGMVGMIAVLSFTVTKRIINKTNEEKQRRLTENIKSATTTANRALATTATVPETLTEKQVPGSTLAPENAQGQEPMPEQAAAGKAASNINPEANKNDDARNASANSLTASGKGSEHNGMASKQARSMVNTTALNTVHGSKENNTAGKQSVSKKQRAAITRSLQKAENMFNTGSAAAILAEENTKAIAMKEKAPQAPANEEQKSIADKDVAQKEATSKAKEVNPAAAKASGQENPTASKKAENEKATAKKQHHFFENFGLGIKAGYEKGNMAAAEKYVVAPYVQYNVSQKVAILLQPAVKYGTLKTHTIGQPQSYYKLNNDASTTHVKDVIAHDGGSVVYTTTYNYSQTHDSIVKTNTIGGAYYEAELPLLLQYKICSKVAVYGGVNGIYSKMPGITEQTYVKAGIVKSADNTVVGINEVPAPQPFNEVISYTGTSLAEYGGPKYSAQASSFFRLGYMLGLSYEYSDRWLIDALIQQSPTKPAVKEGYNINIPLSSAYFRLSVGYKFKK